MVDNKPATRQGWAIPILVSLAILLPQFVTLVYNPSPGTNIISTEWLATGMIQSASQVLLLAVIIGVSGRSREFGVRKPSPRDIPAAVLIFGGMLLIGSLVALIMVKLGFAYLEPATARPELSPLALVILAAGFALASAYREELFYRAFLLGSCIQRSAPPAAAVGVSVILFAWGHAYQGPVGMVAAACTGLFLALAWLRGTSVHALSLGHAAYNLGILLTLTQVPDMIVF
jgi:membrane protease YdiL (CAAX protease family)